MVLDTQIQLIRDENRPENEVFLCPSADIHEQCPKMTIKTGSSLSMDAQGINVCVGHPTERHDYSTRFKAVSNGTNIYKCKENDRDVLYGMTQRTPPLVEVARHVDDWCKVATEGFGKIVINIPRWPARNVYENTHQVASCQEFVIHSNDETTITFWINRIQSGPRSLTIKPEIDAVFRRFKRPDLLSREFAQLPVWTNEQLKELVLMHWVPFTDREFLRLRVPWFEIMSESVSDNAINQYLHLWSSGALKNTKRIGISVERPIDTAVILKGLLVVPWDDEFCEKMTDLAMSKRSGETRYTVFRSTDESNGAAGSVRFCSNGTLSITLDDSVFFDVGTSNFDHEQKLNETQRERAAIAP
ncbi:unnamed protein product [Caenorhabditis sp. 36 PRJEB53466]|nr:unnamed protein product [Caenorhabditis sp. 36 PRJEB53466]